MNEERAGARSDRAPEPSLPYARDEIAAMKASHSRFRGRGHADSGASVLPQASRRDAAPNRG